MSEELTEVQQKRIEIIENKLSELENKVCARAKNIKEDLSEEGDVLVKNIKAGAGEICDELAPLMEKYKVERDELVCAAEKKISDHPFVSVAVAFGAGLILASLLERKIGGSDR